MELNDSLVRPWPLHIVVSSKGVRESAITGVQPTAWEEDPKQRWLFPLLFTKTGSPSRGEMLPLEEVAVAFASKLSPCPRPHLGGPPPAHPLALDPDSKDKGNSGLVWAVWVTHCPGRFPNLGAPWRHLSKGGIASKGRCQPGSLRVPRRSKRACPSLPSSAACLGVLPWSSKFSPCHPHPPSPWFVCLLESPAMCPVPRLMPIMPSIAGERSPLPLPLPVPAML